MSNLFVMLQFNQRFVVVWGLVLFLLVCGLFVFVVLACYG